MDDPQEALAEGSGASTMSCFLILQKRVESSIEVNAHEVLEVLRVCRGERIASVVGERPGIHEVGK